MAEIWVDPTIEAKPAEAKPAEAKPAARSPRLSPGASTLPQLAGGALPGLDGLRAISVLLVMFSHYGYGKFVPGALGVTVFFFLSGFLITTLMLREYVRTDRIAIGAFLMRRLLRLGPEMLGLVVVSGVAALAYTGLPRLADVLAALFYVSNYYQILGLAGYYSHDFRWPHLWSLAVEQHFYLIYPFVFSLTIRNARTFLVVLSLTCLAALALRYAIMLTIDDTQYVYVATETRIDSIAYGCIGAFLLWRHGDVVAAWLRGANWIPVALGLALIGLTLVLRNDHLFRETARYSIQGLGLALFIGGLFVPPGLDAVISALDFRPLAWMGRMSYAAYLWHIDVLKFLEWAAPTKFAFAGSLSALAFSATAAAATFFIAWLSHIAIYEPVLKLRRSYGSRAH